LLSGAVAAGTWLRQEALAERFGVSRTPVREALRELQSRGLVELRPHRGALVRGYTARDIRDAYEVRAELEGLAAELAATRIADRQLEELRAAQALFRRAIDAIVDGNRSRRGAPAPPPRDTEWTRANDAFHEVILGAAGNARLLEAVQDLHRSFPRDLTWAALSGNSRLLEQNVEEHRRVLEAIEARDAAQARERMVAHVRHAGELIARGLEEREPKSA
jgi:DNA-binding GntR family transcriptional regulator